MLVEMDNAAFEENEELSRILTEAANKVNYDDGHTTFIYDFNGNRVGRWKITR